jgi:uncharacterized protein (DUF1684 family)
MNTFRAQVACALALLLMCAPRPSIGQAASATAAAPSEYQLQVEAWRQQREHELAAPDGWLTLVGLEWLKNGVNTFGAAADNSIQLKAQAPEHIGLLTVSGNVVQLLAPPGGFPPDLKTDGQPAREESMSADDEKPSSLTWHGLKMVVLPRGGRYALRIMDADSPTRTNFHGLHWYAPDPQYRITARWIPFTPPHIEKIPTIIGTTLDLPAPGVAEFTLHAKTVRLEPVLESPHDTSLFFILRDATSQTTTYQAARFLRTSFPDHGLGAPGNLTLDFNEVYNPPCAYTPYATCPLPPPQNRLAVAIEAGEQRYSH